LELKYDKRLDKKTQKDTIYKLKIIKVHEDIKKFKLKLYINNQLFYYEKSNLSINQKDVYYKSLINQKYSSKKWR